jgi:DNA-binding IclR family transcriptional regulator
MLIICDMRFTKSEEGPVSVLGRALTLLECFADSDEQLSLAELSHRSGISKATTFRLVRELSDWRYIDRTSGGLRLGVRLFELGSQVQPYALLRTTSQPILRDLTGSTGRYVHLAVLEGASITYLDKVEPRRGDIALPSRVGGRMPAHCTALGKALLARSSSDVVRAVFENPLVRRTARTVVAPGLLGRELMAVRASGVAFDREEAVLGVVCASAAFPTQQESGWAALSLSGRATGESDLHRMADLTQTYASHLSLAMLAAAS